MLTYYCSASFTPLQINQVPRADAMKDDGEHTELSGNASPSTTAPPPAAAAASSAPSLALVARLGALLPDALRLHGAADTRGGGKDGSRREERTTDTTGLPLRRHFQSVNQQISCSADRL